MSQAIYLSQKSTTQPLVIFIQTNKHLSLIHISEPTRHNPNGWIEKSNGKTVKLWPIKHR